MNFFRDSAPLNSTKYVWNSRAESVGGDVNQVWLEKARATLHPHLSDEDIDLRGVLDAQEGEQEEEETVNLNIKQSC